MDEQAQDPDVAKKEAEPSEIQEKDSIQTGSSHRSDPGREDPFTHSRASYYDSESSEFLDGPEGDRWR